MNDNKHVMTSAEMMLSKLGFHLLEQENVKINNHLFYPVIKYARYLDANKNEYDMVITFDPAQYCIELWQLNSDSFFADPKLLNAIQERAKELDF